MVTKDEVTAVLADPILADGLSRGLIEVVAIEIEAELAGAEYNATPDESAAINEGLTSKAQVIRTQCPVHNDKAVCIRQISTA